MKIAIVDDDSTHLDLLSCLVHEELEAMNAPKCVIDRYPSAEAFLNAWHPGMYTLVILDIFMGKMTGIQLAYKIREQDHHLYLAFCTSSNDFACESYDVGARHYLLKPVTRQGIQRLLSRLDLQSAESARTVRLPDGHITVVNGILYTEYENHVITVHTAHEGPHRLRTSQTELEALLYPTGQFFSPYKGIIVNFHAVASITDTDVTLTNGISLPITRRRLKEFREAYKKYRFNKVRREMMV